MSGNKEVNRIARALIQDGFYLDRTNRHRVFKKPGERMIILPTTIGQGRGLRNLIASLNRRGIQV